MFTIVIFMMNDIHVFGTTTNQHAKKNKGEEDTTNGITPEQGAYCRELTTPLKKNNYLSI